MKQAPQGLPTPLLVEAIESGWTTRIQDLAYVPIGFGAHHWRASSSNLGELFVSVHDLDRMGSRDQRDANFRQLGSALGTAHWLESVAGLDFVLGPLPDREGRVVGSVAERFAVHVYPWFECAPLDDPDGSETARIVGRLHAVTDRLPPSLTGIEDFAIPHRDALHAAMDEVGTRWAGGPYAERARDQLREHERNVRALLAFYDRGARRAARSRPDWVLTHGEPRGPNLARGNDGAVRLIDWDTALIAPPERDLWELPRTEATRGAYRAAAPNTRLADDCLRLYEARYSLAELGEYLAVFRAPHDADPDVTEAWQNYLHFLPTEGAWPELR